jgi:hypothetical protein
MTFATVNVDVEVTLDNVESYDLIEELKSRGEYDDEKEWERSELLRQIYQKMCMKQSYAEEMRDFMWLYYGKMV